MTGSMHRNAFYRSFIKTSRKAFFVFLFLHFFFWPSAPREISRFPHMTAFIWPHSREIQQVIGESKESEKTKKRPELGISYQGVRAGSMRRNAFYRSFIKTSRKAFFDFLFLQFFFWPSAPREILRFLHMTAFIWPHNTT